jgi:asparagine synthase (glutamine-hydrolysing)
MADAVRHRGPDAAGAWADAEAGIAFGHRRLSIVDLSDAGAQPMASASGRFVLSYNGEIYNAPDVARDLTTRGHRFRGHSDTEVLVEAIDEWGVTDALTRMNGMFAFAVWDARHRCLSLARDRMGEKPLYYGWFGSLLLFGSELKALRAHQAFDAAIDRDALAAYLRVNCVPAPFSIYEGVRKLPPACVLTIDATAQQIDATPEPFWSVPAQGSGPAISATEATDRLDELLARTCRSARSSPEGSTRRPSSR